MAPGFTPSTAKSYLTGISMRKVDIDANVGSALYRIPIDLHGDDLYCGDLHWDGVFLRVSNVCTRLQLRSKSITSRLSSAGKEVDFLAGRSRSEDDDIQSLIIFNLKPPFLCPPVWSTLSTS